MILTDKEIRERNIFTPCKEQVSGKGILSYGLSSCGYDVTLSNKFVKFWPQTEVHMGGYEVDCVMSPKEKMPEDAFEYLTLSEDEDYILEPGECVLASTEEYFTVPDDVAIIIHDKSSYARLGVSVFNTVAEPGWKGNLTLEIKNNGPFKVKLKVGEGIAQAVCHKLTGRPEVTYADRSGKYQGSTGVTISK